MAYLCLYAKGIPVFAPILVVRKTAVIIGLVRTWIHDLPMEAPQSATHNNVCCVDKAFIVGVLETTAGHIGKAIIHNGSKYANGIHTMELGTVGGNGGGIPE